MTDEQRLFLDDANEIVDRLYRDLKQLRATRLQGSAAASSPRKSFAACTP